MTKEEIKKRMLALQNAFIEVAEVMQGEDYDPSFDKFYPFQEDFIELSSKVRKWTNTYVLNFENANPQEFREGNWPHFWVYQYIRKILDFMRCNFKFETLEVEDIKVNGNTLIIQVNYNNYESPGLYVEYKKANDYVRFSQDVPFDIINQNIKLEKDENL
jgi:hypothetical protein